MDLHPRVPPPSQLRLPSHPPSGRALVSPHARPLSPASGHGARPSPRRSACHASSSSRRRVQCSSDGSPVTQRAGPNALGHPACLSVPPCLGAPSRHGVSGIASDPCALFPPLSPARSRRNGSDVVACAPSSPSPSSLPSLPPSLPLRGSRLPPPSCVASCPSCPSCASFPSCLSSLSFPSSPSCLTGGPPLRHAGQRPRRPRSLRPHAAVGASRLLPSRASPRAAFRTADPRGVARTSRCSPSASPPSAALPRELALWPAPKSPP
mmetsp:Transcript_10384/g.39289  ORF Transcript_10384/g.39289 Transcript_10384/m.39289 type:complete len:266 (-) Transcript_10384:323-1120(-)